MRGWGGRAGHTRPLVSGVHRLSRRAPLGAVGAGVSPPPPPSGQAGGDGRGGSRGSGGKVGEPGPQHSWVRVCTVVWVRAGGVPPWPEGPLRLPGTHSPPPSTRAGLAQGGCCHGAVEWKWGSGKAQDPPPHLPPIPPWGWEGVVEPSLGGWALGDPGLRGAGGHPRLAGLRVG